MSIDNKKRVKFSEEQVQLFRYYKLDREQIGVFVRLRACPDVSLSDERLIWCICSKKTVEKAKNSAIGYQKILDTYKVDELVLSQDFFNQRNSIFKKLVKMESFFYGMHNSPSREGYGIFYMDYGHWVPMKGKEEASLVMGIFIILFENLMKKRPENVTNGVLYIADFGNFGWKNFDFYLEKLAANVLKSMPCRMRGFVMFDCPWWISTIIKLLKPFYSKKIMSRMITCKKSELSKHVDVDNLIEQFGGKERFDYCDWVSDEFNVTFTDRPKRYFSLQKRRKQENKEEEEEEEEEEVEGEEEN